MTTSVSAMDPNKYVLKPHDIVGAMLFIEGGFISITAVLVVFLCIMVDVVRQKLAHPYSSWRLIQVPMDLYMISLLVADFFVASAAAISVYWVHSGEIVLGGFCVVQGAMLRFGQIGLAITNLAITLHTISVVFWRKGVHALLTTKLVIAGIWLYAAVMTILFYTVIPKKASRSAYIIPMPGRCWVPPMLSIMNPFLFVLHTVAIVAGLLVSLPLYLSSRGIIGRREDSWWKFTIVWPRSRNVDEDQVHTLYLLLYPIGYLIVCFPALLASPNWALSTLLSLDSIFCLCGLYDVIVLRYMRSGLLKVNEVKPQSDMGRLPKGFSGSGGWDPELSVHSEGKQN